MGRRVLVVDDNPDSADSLVMLLSMTGNEVHVAYDGLAAIEAAAMLRPDVILLDIGLPKLNGYETAYRIREQPWGKDMILVVRLVAAARLPDPTTPTPPPCSPDAPYSPQESEQRSAQYQPSAGQSRTSTVPSRWNWLSPQVRGLRGLTLFAEG